MPEVQMPHCSAAISRNFCCSGCSLLALRHALDGADLVALGFDREHQAGADQAIVERDRQAPQSPERAAFLGAGQRRAARAARRAWCRSARREIPSARR